MRYRMELGLAEQRSAAIRFFIQNGRPWQKTNLVNIAPGRGSAWCNRKWQAMTKD